MPIRDSGIGRDYWIPLYIHIPFCKTLCPFCCFNRYLFKEDSTRAYFQSLKRELALYIQRGFKFSNFYFGDGTPTVLMDELIGFIGHLKESFEVKHISVETTPREVNQRNIDLLRAAGINRLSIGVQSFDNDTLKAMGRLFYTGEEAKEKLLLASREFDTLNADFLFNFPSQSIEKFEADVEVFRSLDIDQATFYPLMPSPYKKTSLERRFRRIDTSREKRFYEVILRDVYAEGYKASTVWCFSKGERMIDEYIINHDDYIGIGAGSISLLGGNIYVNSFSLERYEKFLAKNRLPIVRQRKLSTGEYFRYYLLAKLFGLKVDTGQFSQKFSADVHKKLREELLFFKLVGLIQEEDGKITVTQEGMYQVNVMMREFFSSLNGLREYCIENQI